MTKLEPKDIEEFVSAFLLIMLMLLSIVALFVCE